MLIIKEDVIMWKKTFYMGALLVGYMLSCNSQTGPVVLQGEPVRINRFDRALLQWLENPADSIVPDSIASAYRPMLELTGKAILNVQSPEQKEFYPRLRAYYSEPTLRQLYRDAVASFDSISDIEQALGGAFAFLRDQFQDHKIPAFYMHVSGFGQNVLVADSVLSLSIDKYLGDGYSLYQHYFSDYERAKMTRGFVVEDYIMGWLMGEFPFEGRDNVLLDRMVYAGKIYYVASLCLPGLTAGDLLGYREEAAAWCRDNEGLLWKNIIERKHLYTPDIATTQRYFDNRPSAFLSDRAPGNIGSWVGLQIVSRYMDETGSSLSSLMSNNDAQGILSRSKYKP